MPGAILEVANVRNYNFLNLDTGEQHCGVADRIDSSDFCSGTLCVWAHTLDILTQGDTITVILEADPFTADSPATLFTETQTIAQVVLTKNDVANAPLYKTNSFIGNFGSRLRVRVVGARSGGSSGDALDANISVSLCMKTGSTVGPDFGSQDVQTQGAFIAGQAAMVASDGDIRFESTAKMMARNNADTANAEIFQFGSVVDGIEFGDDVVVTSVTYSAKAAGSHKMNVGGSSIFQVSNKLESFVNTLQWRSTLDPEIKQDDISSASDGHDMVVQSQRNSGAGNDGAVIVKVGTSEVLTAAADIEGLGLSGGVLVSQRTGDSGALLAFSGSASRADILSLPRSTTGAGNDFEITGQDANGVGNGGLIGLEAGKADTNGVGGTASIEAGNSAGTNPGGDVTLQATTGVGTNQNGGMINFKGGGSTGSGVAGTTNFECPSPALGGGATATLGTIGGSGPGTAAQNQWLEIEIDGVRHWIPVWQ